MAKQALASETEVVDELTRGHKKKARTRQQLLEAALRIYARKNTGELALNELAEEAGLSNGTVYNYFRTREEVLEAVGIALAEALSHEVTSASVGVSNGAQRVATGVRTFLLKTQDDPEWASALITVVRVGEGMRSAFAAHLRADLQMGLQQGEFKYENEDVAAALVISVAMGAMATIVDGQTIERHDSIVAEMILLALGVSTQKARRIASLPMPQSPLPEAAAPASPRQRR